jgi:ABC-type dipeptide/oligopeptide/nickel transport system ATPase subunit
MHLPADVRLAVVGRGREQAGLAAAVAGARAGHGQAVLLPGESGMGKSMLADWVVGLAAVAGGSRGHGARWP